MTDKYGKGLSCAKRILPIRYKPIKPKITTHKARKTSRSRNCQLYAKSTLDKNFKANASSKKPSTTLTLLSQPPDLGRDFIIDGNIAKSTRSEEHTSELQSRENLVCR